MLTPAGRRMLRRMWPTYARELEATVVCALSERDARTLAAMLAAVRDSAR